MRLPTTFDLARTGMLVFGMPRNAFISIDVTRRCNLRCKHCYFFNEDPVERDLSDEEWLHLLEAWKRRRTWQEMPFFACTWVGGEPLLRRELIDRARAYFRYNVVVTNGTLPLPDWPDVHWYVSIDGDRATHESIRCKRGIYSRAMRHVSARPAHLVTIAYCITRENAHCIHNFLRDWLPIARYFTFDFYTPNEGEPDDPLWVPWEERDAILAELMELVRAHPGRLRPPLSALRLMHSSTAAEVTRDCLFAKRATSFDASGRSKEKCVMGPAADCSRCGCIVPFYLHVLTNRRLAWTDMTSALAGSWARVRGGRGAEPTVLPGSPR